MLPGHVVGLHSEMFQELNAQRNVPGIKKNAERKAPETKEKITHRGEQRAHHHGRAG
jgi:hypothetical protein